jgi:hypothetical protein
MPMFYNVGTARRSDFAKADATIRYAERISPAEKQVL